MAISDLDRVFEEWSSGAINSGSLVTMAVRACYELGDVEEALRRLAAIDARFAEEVREWARATGPRSSFSSAGSMEPFDERTDRALDEWRDRRRP